MSLPLFDDIDLPPDATLVDVNTLSDEYRNEYQARAFGYWMEEEGISFEDFEARDWNGNEGIFVVMEDGAIIGVAIIFDVESVNA